MNKKFIVMAAFAAMFSISFTSCSNNDDDLAGAGVAQSEAKTPITLAGYLNNIPTTRGWAASNEDVQADGLSVWAFDATKETAISTAADFFMGGPSAGLAHGWDGTNSYYKAAVDYFWPEYALNFVALTPQTGGGIGTIGISQAAAATPGSPSKPVMTVAVDVPLTTESDGTYGTDNQKDIMIASSENTSAPSGFAPAPLTFKHALSQIVFKGIVDNTTTIHKAVVKSIKLVNVASNGTITYTASSDAFEAGDWGDKNKTYAANIVNTDVTATDAASADAITGQADNASGRNYQLMIMPQTSKENTGVAAENLNISCLETSPGVAPVAGTYLLVNATLYANGNNANAVLENTTNVYIPLESTTWEPGYKYTYLLKFGDNLLHPITFTASVAAWTDANNNVEF